MHKLLKQAFTLIELLVVIAIIGILSGLIIVGMNGMTDKANIAKSQVFSNSLRNSLMMNLISEWKLDEGTGQATSDSWSGLNNGTFGSTTGVDVNDPIWTTSGCIQKYCLFFDGINDYINLGSNNVLNISSNMSIEMWIKGSKVTIIKGGEPETYSAGTRNSVPFFYRELQDGTNEYLNGSISVNTTQWHHLVMIDDGSVMKIYIDSAKDPNTISSADWSAGTDLSNVYFGKGDVSGSEAASAGFFSGYLDEVRIYDAAVPASQIKERYYAGLNKLMAKGEIKKEDYQNRIGGLATKL